MPQASVNLQLIETIRGEQATAERLFGGAAGRVRVRNTPQYLARLAEAAVYTARVMEGEIPLSQLFARLQEAHSTSDFPQLFGDVLQRQLLGTYQATTPVWSAIARRSTVPDFRTVKRFAVDGGEGVLAAVAEGATYPAATIADSQYTYNVAKYGRTIPFTWEAMVNDDLQALRDIPARFARAAQRSESKFCTQLYADANGPHASLYTSGNTNIINTTNGAAVTNPPLSIAGLQDAMTVLGKMRDTDGEPIDCSVSVLVVPPALRIVAKNILNATELRVNTAGGYLGALANSEGYHQELMTGNWMKGEVLLVVDPYLPIVTTTGTRGDTSWYLFASPSVGRPALEMGFLRGHEAPELFMQMPTAQRIGGGSNAMDGSFDTDALAYKVRHCFGGVILDGKATVASNGTGS
jgi:hypothetical protein